MCDEICEGSGSGSGGLQTNFDLLGELIKFNPVVLRLLDAVLNLNDNNKRFDSFIQVVRLHLVDSNVLLRSILLTIEYETIFCTSNTQGSNCMMSTTRFHDYLHEKNQPELLSDICTIVQPNLISQENLCCLNSSLVLLLFARRKNHLVSFLNAIKQIEMDRGTPGSIRKHFRQLLWFWKEYYLNRASDRMSLENSSRIEFFEFAEIVHVLTEDNDSDTSLLQSSSVEWSEFHRWTTRNQQLLELAVGRQRQ